MGRYWDRHNQGDREAMGELLLPLVAASRPADFVDVADARVQVLAFLQALEDVPRELVAAAVAARVKAGVTWMPKPGELKADCAKLREGERLRAWRRHIAGCPHPSQYVDTADGRGVERCPCWRQAQAAMAEPIQAPLLLRAGDDEVGS